MAEMEIARNDMVMGPGGIEVGRIAHVILDGTSERVTDLVVARPDGSEFTVPITTVRQEGPGVFMMRTAPEKIAGEHPFEANGYREVEERGSKGDRVVVPFNSTPGTFSASGGAINQYTPRPNSPIPSSPPASVSHMAPPASGSHMPPPASVSHMTPPTSGIHMPPPPTQSPPPPVTMRFEHTPQAATTSAAASSPAGAIRREIADTNTAASHAPTPPKVDAPQEKAAPAASLKEQVVDAVHEQVSAVKTQVTDAVHEQVAATKGQIHEMTVGQARITAGHARDNAQGAASNVVEMIRANPLPAALLGLGVGWLWKEHQQKNAAGMAASKHRYNPPMQGSGYRNQNATRSPQSDDSSLGDKVGGAAGKVGDKVGDAAGHVKDAVGSVAGQTQERASHLADQTGETVGNFVDAAQEHVGDLTGHVSDLTSNVRDTAGGFGSGVVQMVRANPIPAALTSIGIGWLLMNRSQGNGSTSMNRGKPLSSPASLMHMKGSMSTSGQGQSQGSAINALGDAAGTAKAKAGQLVGQAGDGVSTLAESAQERARDLGTGAQNAAKGTQSRVVTMLHENPMNVGMVALSLGIAAGFLLPETPTEDRFFGAARDALMGQTAKTIQKSQKMAQDLQKVVEDMQALTPPR